MGFLKQDKRRNACMLTGSLRKQGYDWWWHSFTGVDPETGEERPFFIEFFLCNPALAEDRPILGQAPENKAAGKRPSYLMVKAGCWGEERCQLHRFFSWNDVKLRGRSPFSIGADDCACSDRVLRGSVCVTSEEAEAHPEYMCGAGKMEWDLRVMKLIPFNVGYGAGGFFRLIKAFEMYWHAEGMKSAFTGSVTINGRRFEVRPESCFGYSDKNWGRNFTSPWVWLSSNDLVSVLTGERLMNSAFDIGGGRPKIYFLPLERKLLGAMCYEGKEYEFNFSKFWTGTKTEFGFEEEEELVRWRVRQENRKALMESEFTCKKEDMLFVNYESPDGEKRHKRLWNGGNGVGTVKLYDKTEKGLELVDSLKVGHLGCEYGEYENE